MTPSELPTPAEVARAVVHARARRAADLARRLRDVAERTPATSKARRAAVGKAARLGELAAGTALTALRALQPPRKPRRRRRAPAAQLAFADSQEGKP